MKDIDLIAIARRKHNLQVRDVVKLLHGADRGQLNGFNDGNLYYVCETNARGDNNIGISTLPGSSQGWCRADQLEIVDGGESS